MLINEWGYVGTSKEYVWVAYGNKALKGLPTHAAENLETSNLKKYVDYRGFPGKPPGGWGFFPPLSVEASRKKTPPALPSFVKNTENQRFQIKPSEVVVFPENPCRLCF